MNKKAIRQQMLEQRQKLSLQEQHWLMAQILHQAEQVLNFKPKLVFTYSSISSKIELPTELIIEWWQNQQGHFEICMPKVDHDDMDAILIDAETTFTPNKWQIKEPENGTIVAPATIDVVLVPLLAFDANGYRVGYGKGFYDKYLVKCKPNTMFLGINWFDAVDSIIDIEAYDVPLTHCITPNKWYAFKK